MKSPRLARDGHPHDATFICDECSIIDFQDGCTPWRKNDLYHELRVCRKCLVDLRAGKESEAYDRAANPVEQLVERLLTGKLTKIDRKRLKIKAVRDNVRAAYRYLKRINRLGKRLKQRQ